MLKDVRIPLENNILLGNVYKPLIDPKAWIIFSHGSGSSHFSSRNQKVAKNLLEHQFGSLLFDLLTSEEESILENRFNISLLSKRLLLATSWLMNEPYYQKGTPIAYFGASTGAAAALTATAECPQNWPIYSVVSRGGRVDLTEVHQLKKLHIPILLILGERDYEVIRLNMMVQNELENSEMVFIPNAGHLFEEPGSSEKMIHETIKWFENHLPPLISEAVL